MDIETKFASAKSLLAARNYAEAGKLFGEIWRENKSPFAVSKYIHCLRKAGHPGWAIKVGGPALRDYPNDRWIRSELIWAHYDAHIKPAKESEDLGAILKHAQALLALQPEDLPFRLTVQAVIYVAKRKEKWQLVSDWCDCLDPKQLEAQAPKGANGHRLMSDRQKWYFAKIPSLLKLERWEEARQDALAATVDYPREDHFRRWAALALANQGKVKEAIAELEKLTQTSRETWYALKDLCDLYKQMGKYEEALRYGCRAALGEKEHKLKTTLYEMLAEIGLRLEKPDFAAMHVVLAKATRQAESWKLRPDFLQLEEQVREALLAAGGNWPQEDNIKALAKKCEKEWHNHVYAGLQRQNGVIENLPDGKGHGWLRAEDGTRVFFLQKDVPKAHLREGERVSYVLVSSWDRKREQESTRAIDFRPQ